MNQIKTKIAMGVLLALVAGSASATLYNDRDPAITIGSSGSEPSLQDVLDAAVGVGTISAANDQSAAAIWEKSEADTAAYTVSMNGAASPTGVLGIYSYVDNSKTAVLSFDAANTVDFEIVNGTLSVNGSYLAGFGSQFGFYWDTSAFFNGTNISYTEDDRNVDGEAMALTYEVADLTEVTLDRGVLGTDTITAKSNDDWIIAFEDNDDADFQDAVFFIEDMSKIPVPATLALFGLGLLGLGWSRKKA